MLPAWSFAFVVALGGSAESLAGAAHTPAPSDCVRARASSAQTPNAPGPWQSARGAALQRDCQALAQGYALLSRDPQRALELARSLLDGALSRHARVLSARGALHTGDVERAWLDFERVREADAVLLSPPLSLRDAALATALSGHDEQADADYRALVPAWRLLPHGLQAPVLIEAALATLRVGPMSLGPESHARARREEASRLLALALSLHEHRGSLPYALAAQALLAARSGTPPTSMLRLDPAALERSLRTAQAPPGAPRLPPGELFALIAAASEQSDPERAAEHWREYARSPAGKRWGQWVSERLASLGAGG